ERGLKRFRRRRQAGQVERHPAHEGAPVGLGREGEAGGLQLREEEGVHRVADAGAVLDGRYRRAHRRAEGPRFLVVGARTGRGERPIFRQPLSTFWCERAMNAPTTAEAAGTHGKPAKVERRAAPRYRCLSECLVQLEGAAVPLDWPGMVYNISAGGVGMALPFP